MQQAGGSQKCSCIIMFPGSVVMFEACFKTPRVCCCCRFDLAIQLGDLEVAADIGNSLDTPAKWRQLGKCRALASPRQ